MADLLLFGLLFGAVSVAAAELHVAYLNRASELGRVERHAQVAGPVGTLIVGDSHPVAALPEEQLPDGYLNYAFSGESYLTTHYRLDDVLNSVPVDRVVLQASFHSFIRPAGRGEVHDWYWSRRLNYAAIAMETGDPSWLVRFVRGRFMSYTSSRTLLERSLRSRMGSWSDDPGPDDETEVTPETRAAEHYVEYVSPDPVLLGRFRQSVLSAVAAGAEVVVLRYPVHPDYIAGVPDDARVTLQQLMDRVFDAAPPVRLVDATTVFFDRPDYFTDPDHLNAQGAAAFAVWLDAHLQDPAAGTGPG